MACGFEPRPAYQQLFLSGKFMNTNPQATSVLCYGDSNTFGVKPDRSGRFAADVRWPGILQELLGPDYYVIEEGLGGRTTDLDHYNPSKPARNGLAYFKACLESHSPLDVVIIMLGTNDFKTVYGRSAAETAAALKQYVDLINETYGANPPRVVLVSPPYMDDAAPAFESSMPQPGIYDEGSVRKTHELAGHIQELSQRLNVEFLDAGPITSVGDDGCHIDADSHKKLGLALARLIN